MPTFEIPDVPATTVKLERARSDDPKKPGPAEGSAAFTVNSNSSEDVPGRLSVLVAAPSKAEWFTIEGARERTFRPGAQSETVIVKISVPPSEKPGDYPFRLRAVTIADPDNDHAEGPVTTAKVPPAENGGGSRWWIWLLVALAVLIVLGVVAWLLFKPDGDPEPVDPTNNTVPATPTVPKFVDQAVDSIAVDAGGYQIIKNETPNSGRPPRIVYEQDPAPETPLAAGNRVIVSYEPGVLVPDLPASATFTSAPNILRSAGLEPGSFLCDSSSGQVGAVVGRVTAFNPAPGTRVASGSKVNMRAVQQGRCSRPVIFFDSRIRDAQKVSTSRQKIVLPPR